MLPKLAYGSEGMTTSEYLFNKVTVVLNPVALSLNNVWQTTTR